MPTLRERPTIADSGLHGVKEKGQRLLAAPCLDQLLATDTLRGETHDA
jgi:hypothetical protein